MSEGEETILQTEDGQMLTAEYRDGRLQIVEVTPYDKNMETHIIPDSAPESEEPKYIQVLDPSGKGVMHLNLLNFTLVKCGDQSDDGSYPMVGSSSDDGGETTLTCVLSNDDQDEQNQDEQNKISSYMLFESVEQNETEEAKAKTENIKKPPLTPIEILEKAKALQKSKALLDGRRVRKRKGIPAAAELLASPNFKLYLYSCKLCSFKCNAIKDMSAHKALEHGAGSSSGRRCEGPRSRTANLQCAKCPFRAAVHTQLLKHVQDVHIEKKTSYIFIDVEKKDSDPPEASSGGAVEEVLVCGACSFECGARQTFLQHMQTVHHVTFDPETDILSVEEMPK